MAEPAPLLSLAHQYVPERRQVPPPQDDWPKAVYRTELLVARVQKAVPLQASLALQPEPDDEWESPQAQTLRVRQASQPAAPPLVQEPVPWEQPLSALLVHSALPQAQREPQARSVSQRSAQRSLEEARQASSARPSQPLPSLLFPLWQPLPLAPLLRRRPESFCALFQRRPRESSSNASSFL